MAEFQHLDTAKVRRAGKTLVVISTVLTTFCVCMAIVFHRVVGYLIDILKIHYSDTDIPDPGILLSYYKALVELFGGYTNYLLARSIFLVVCWVILGIISWWLYCSLQHVLRKYTELEQLVKEAKKEIDE